MQKSRSHNNRHFGHINSVIDNAIERSFRNIINAVFAEEDVNRRARFISRILEEEYLSDIFPNRERNTMNGSHIN